MKTQIFAIYDEKAESYLQPFFLPTENMAIRTFTDCVNDPQHPFHNHAGDYTLFKIGIFSHDHGTITADHPHAISNGVSVRSQSEAINKESSTDSDMGTGSPKVLTLQKDGNTTDKETTPEEATAR